MTYEQIAGITQPAVTLLFLLIFIAATAYALWPSNRSTFERAARLPLDSGSETDDGERPS